MADWPDVARVLLGSWPQQVAAWGKEGIAAYVAGGEGPRGLTPGRGDLRAADVA